MVAPAMGCAFLLGSAASTLAFSSAPKLASHWDQMSYHFWRITSVHLGSVIQDTRCFVKRPFLRASACVHDQLSGILYAMLLATASLNWSASVNTLHSQMSACHQALCAMKRGPLTKQAYTSGPQKKQHKSKQVAQYKPLITLSDPGQGTRRNGPRAMSRMRSPAWRKSLMPPSTARQVHLHNTLNRAPAAHRPSSMWQMRSPVWR